MTEDAETLSSPFAVSHCEVSGCFLPPRARGAEQASAPSSGLTLYLIS